MVAKKIYKFPIKIICSPKNGGFSYGNNLGVKFSDSDKLIFISNDVRILGDFITPIIEYLNDRPNRAISSRLLNFNTGWNAFTKLGIIPYLEGWNISLIKQNHYMINGWDENFFVDYEDIDYSYRLHLAGIGLSQIELPLMHELGGSFSGLSKTRLEYTLTSQRYFCDKWGVEHITL